MMFRTELTIAPVAQQLPTAARVLTLGSCFADSIGARLAADKVNVLVNPFGTVFQPLAAGRLLRAALGEDVDWQQHLVEARGRWQSYDLHGSQGAASPVELLHDVQQTVQRTGEFLRGADVVLLTLGTAWAYRLRETGELVSNCHKMPAELFEKELLTPDDIINGLAETHAYLRRSNPKLRIILTVSPVRHLRDTLPLNAVSKSVLRVACHYLSELLPDVSYFPAYELLTDDLRDYRFYSADMLHPSEVAVDYVWEKFARTYFDADFGRFRKEWAGLRQALAHRPLNAAAPEHRQFLESTKERLERLGRQRVNVAAELREVDERLATLPVPTGVAAPEPAEGGEREHVGSAEAVPPPAPMATALNPDEAPATSADRPARLSPEEFRAQRTARNNRPGRGRREDRNVDPGPEQPAAAPAAAADAAVTAAAAIGLATPIEAFDDSVVETSPAVDGGELDPAKKKKRRSRGGAKRTARKNAARLAATGGEGEALLKPESDEVTAGAPADLPDNPQPDARKPSVITKSVPVKRGGRGRERSEETSIQADALVQIPSLPEGAPAVTPASEAREQPAAPGHPGADERLTPKPADAEPTTPVANQPASRRQPQPKARPLFAAAPVPATEAAAGEEAAAGKEAAAAPTPPAKAAAPKQIRRRPALTIETPPMVPIVPLRTEPRVGVAAGRMRGTDAELVAVPAQKTAGPRATPAKAASPKAVASKAATPKAAAPKASVKKVPAPKAEAPKAAAPKAAPRRKAAAAAAPAAAEAAPVAKRPPAKPRAKKAAKTRDSPDNSSS